jgi:uncharacterized protein
MYYRSAMTDARSGRGGRAGARPRAGRRFPFSRLADILLPRLQPESAVQLARVQASGRLEDLARTRHHLLITYRRDGSPVPTQLWAAASDEHLYIRTERASGKVRRLRRNPRALIAPATVLGRPLGAPLAVRARILDPPEEPVAERALAGAHGWYRRLFEGSVDTMGVDMCYLELTPDVGTASGPAASPGPVNH